MPRVLFTIARSDERWSVCVDGLEFVTAATARDAFHTAATAVEVLRQSRLEAEIADPELAPDEPSASLRE